MKKRTKKILLVFLILLLTPPAIYTSSYLWESRSSMYMFDGLILDSNGVKVWAFNDVKQRLDLFLDPKTPEYEGELKMRKKYLPLIKIDRYLFGNYHIFEDDLPNIGG